MLAVLILYEFRSVVDRVVRNQIYLVSNPISYRPQFLLIININRLYLSSCSVRMRYHKTCVNRREILPSLFPFQSNKN